MRKQQVWTVINSVMFVIGLGGISDDLKQWEVWLTVFLGRGLLSWILMVGGLSGLIYLHWDSLRSFFSGTADKPWWKVLGTRIERCLVWRTDSIWWMMLVPFQIVLLLALYVGPFAAVAALLMWAFG